MRRLFDRFGIVGIAMLLWGVLVPGQSPPSIPSGSGAHDHGKHQAKLKWNPPSGSGAEQPKSYVVYRTKASIKERVVSCGKKWQRIGTTTADVTQYTDTDVEAGRAYCYAVSAVTSRGESSKSFNAAAIIPSP